MLAEHHKQRLKYFFKPNIVDVWKEELKTVKRFSPLAFIIIENLLTHIDRSRDRGMMLPLSETSWQLLDEYLQVHDLPEIIIGDEVAYKISPLNFHLELAAVEKLSLSETQKQRLEEFIFAIESLKKGEKLTSFPDEAVLAAVIDFYDAVEVFHINAPAWFDSHKYKKEKQPENKALIFAIERIKLFQKNLPELKLSPEVDTICQNLLLYALDWIVVHWGQVPTERIPLAMKQRLKWAKKQLRGVDVDNLVGLENFFPRTLF
jgi:hypothetical protein